MPDRIADFGLLLRTLAAHEVDFLVVGGACAVLQGAPMTTVDLDIVHERSPANAARLHAALEELDACYREHLPGKVLRPVPADLTGPGHHLLMTRAGPLDVLGRIGAQRGFEELALESEWIEVDGRRVRVLTLRALVRTKEESGREKDRQGLTLLRHVLEERERREP